MTKRQYREFNCIDCGDDFTTRADYVKRMSGRCRACANIEAGKKRRTHGHNNTNSRLHVTWSNMKRRCLNPTKKEKRNYGNKVRLCKEWFDFVPFMEWALQNGYSEDKTIDRIDSGKGYWPGNCRFVGYSAQSANRKITDKNTTGFIGVYRHKGKWKARVQWMGKQAHIGTFGDAISAATARDNYIVENKLPHTLNNPDDYKDIHDYYKEQLKLLNAG